MSKGRIWMVASGVFVVMLVWAIAVVVTGGQAYSDLRRARTEIVAAERALRDTDLSAARHHLSDGVAFAGSSSSALHRFHLWPLRLVPFVSPNLRAATALSDAARDSGAAAADLLEVASGIVHGDAEARRGEISLAYLAELAPALRQLSSALEHGVDEVADVDDRFLLEPVEKARATYLDLAGPAREQVATAADLAEVLPDFLGGNEPRTYLVAAASLSELRGSGGLLGSWTMLRADAGRLEFGEFRDIDGIANPPADVTGPSAEYARRYADLDGLRQWKNANFTPDFPSSAQVMLELWDTTGAPPADGVIVVDAITFGRLVERSGPLDVGGVTTLTPDDTVAFVGVEAYAAFETAAERHRALGAVATSAFTRMLDVLEDDDIPATVEMLWDLADGGNLRIYSRDPATQSVLVRAGVGGELPAASGEFAGVFVNNVAGNKVDYFTRRDIEHRVELLPEGRTRSTIEVTFDNRAPKDGYPRHVLGPWTAHADVGDNLSMVSFVCGFRCETEPVPGASGDRGTELGRPVTDLFLRIGAGEQRRVQYRTMTADGWSLDRDEIVVPITHAVQPTIAGVRLHVHLDLPAGWEPIGLPDGARVEDAGVSWEADASGPVELTFRLAPVPGQSPDPSNP